MRSLVLCTVLLGFTGCYFDQRDDDRPDVRGPVLDAPHCPSVSPEPGTSCSVPANAPACTYLIEACACGPSDIEWTFTCESGAWYGTRGYDCYPCLDAGVTP